jgi:hypothetical protein
MLCALLLKTDKGKAPENFQMELSNVPCDTNLNQKLSETVLHSFYSYFLKNKLRMIVMS